MISGASVFALAFGLRTALHEPPRVNLVSTAPELRPVTTTSIIDRDARVTKIPNSELQTGSLYNQN